MAERRSLSEGLKNTKAVDPKKEEAFVYGDAPKSASETKPNYSDQPPKPPAQSQGGPGFVGRVLVGARVRPELAATLKRVSLERQLSGRQPYILQEIMEIALTEWLEKNGNR